MSPVTTRNLHLLGMAFATLAVSFAAVSAQADEPAKDAELRAEVPQLFAFHDVIYPLWHEAWPNRDISMLKELGPAIQQHVIAIEAVVLPGILRDRQDAWQAGVAALKETASAYESAITSGQEQALLDAAEALHARFEGLIRIVRPVMKELDAYHVELYQIYHRLMPEKRLAELRSHAQAMAAACQTLSDAAIPQRFAARAEALHKGFADLCEATDRLVAAAAGDDPGPTEAAVEEVHTRYQEVEKLFE